MDALFSVGGGVQPSSRRHGVLVMIVEIPAFFNRRIPALVAALSLALVVALLLTQLEAAMIR